MNIDDLVRLADALEAVLTPAEAGSELAAEDHTRAR